MAKMILDHDCDGGHSDGVDFDGVDVDGGGGEHHCQANVDDVEERKQEGLAGCQTQ